MRVEIWSDVACPWCFVGKRRFEDAVDDFDGEVEVTWRSFELEPDAPDVRDEPLDELLAQKYGGGKEQARQMIERMTQMAEGEGLEFNLMDAKGGNTFDAHRLIHFAADRGRADAMKERLLRAYMTEGKRVSDRETLVALAEDIGLDAEEARTMLATDDYADDVRHDERTARELGCRGVPFYVIAGRYQITGAQSAETFLEALNSAADELEPAQQDAGIVCDDEGCRVEVT
jgi:predicted DsbA family dithiol-disulfide isomerase